ncbi:MAG: SAM-dependent chlorinase/fluorinase, partial [Oscillospiraceae bacterium]|nr:SAM-dependent chlorinase/fluorinase [Oscillospiraceae bacterium]
MGYVVIQTDFGRGGSGAMAGVCKLVDRSVRVYNITHEVPKFDVVAAGHNLTEVIPYWPEGTVFVSVVDPGVGTARKACVALTENGRYVVTPDNGCLEEIRNTYGIAAVREIDQSVNRYKGNEWSLKSDIFHGRDVFAYCGARLACGRITFEEVGPEYPVSEIVSV